MRNRVFSFWIVVALAVLGACAPTVAGNSVDPTASGLSALLEMPARLPDGETVKLQFTLTNNSDVDLYVLKWYTPLEGIGGEIFRVERDGQAIPYIGILATRTDPTPEGYIRLAAGQSASAEVDLATSFDFSQPGEYTVEFLSPRISHVARSEAEMARSVDDLGPVDIPSNTITVQVGGASIEPAAGDHLEHYPLPHSMKGYELYSWYEANEDTWYYTLVSGTNRLKTIEEILVGEVEATADGWVSITVGGEGALETALRRLPRGEQVTWIGPGWLTQVGAQGEMVGTIKLPDGEIVAELEAFCRELGVNIHVAAASDPASQAEPTPPPSKPVLPKETSQDTETSQLVIRKDPIVAAVVDGPGHFEYDDRPGDEILDRIKALGDWSAERTGGPRDRGGAAHHRRNSHQPSDPGAGLST